MALVLLRRTLMALVAVYLVAYDLDPTLFQEPKDSPTFHQAQWDQRKTDGAIPRGYLRAGDLMHAALMVDQNVLPGDRVYKIHFQAHGMPGSQGVGRDALDTSTAEYFGLLLAQYVGKERLNNPLLFVLGGCEVGKNQSPPHGSSSSEPVGALMEMAHKLRSVLGVQVYVHAGKEQESPFTPGWDGQIATCSSVRCWVREENKLPKHYNRF